MALFGPIAGIGDAIFWFTLLPIMAGICSSFASQGNLLGPILFFAVYLLIFFLRVGWTHVGYSVGVKAIDKVRENSRYDCWLCNHPRDHGNRRADRCFVCAY
ncbi:PTS system mannose/fructose/sorbose family transporter subunit IID [Escherichia coli]